MKSDFNFARPVGATSTVISYILKTAGKSIIQYKHVLSGVRGAFFNTVGILSVTTRAFAPPNASRPDSPLQLHVCDSAPVYDDLALTHSRPEPRKRSVLTIFAVGIFNIVVTFRPTTVLASFETAEIRKFCL